MRRRQFIAGVSGVGTALIAGCSGGGGSGGGSGTDDGGGGGGGGGGSGTFRLLISDQPAAIEDFESLDVTLSSARVFRAGEDEEITSAAVTPDEDGTETVTQTETSEPTADETAAETTEGDDEDDEDDEDGEGFVELDLDDVTVDLTEVVGDRAISVLESELEEGRYSGIELRVASAEGVVDGETVDVKVPSDRLRIIKPFEIAADAELSFVFDINVIQKGPNGGYNLLPVIGKSGVVGEDVEVDEVDGDGDSDGTQTTTTATTATTATTEDGSDAGEQTSTVDN